jgi:hypothetical protein
LESTELHRILSPQGHSLCPSFSVCPEQVPASLWASVYGLYGYRSHQRFEDLVFFFETIAGCDHRSVSWCYTTGDGGQFSCSLNLHLYTEGDQTLKPQGALAVVALDKDLGCIHMLQYRGCKDAIQDPGSSCPFSLHSLPG